MDLAIVSGRGPAVLKMTLKASGFISMSMMLDDDDSIARELVSCLVAGLL